jgi:hypothetical protein
MKPSEIYTVLKGIGATHLHHANSVTSSCTYLEQGGLLSREFVESRGLVQTSQASDPIDKEYKIWNRIFLDHVDIHDRGGRKKGGNHYGPVLFVFDLEILLSLPKGTDIGVTKMNPVHWRNTNLTGERWFESPEELSTSIRFGNFDKMLVIQTPSERVDFPNDRAQIILDDPQRAFSSRDDVFTHAEKRLKAAANTGKIKLSIQRRDCPNGCVCINKYAAYSAPALKLWFG